MADKVDLDSFVGCKAFFRTKKDDALYSADIQGFDLDSSTIVFFKVTAVATGKTSNGLQYFHRNEIYDLDVTTEVNTGLRRVSLDKKEVYRKKHEKAIMFNKETPKHLADLISLEPEALLMRDIVDKERKKKDANGNYESKVPENCTLLDNCNSQLFEDAISHLKECCLLGVVFKGIQMGRKGQLCWIVISTYDHTMFFDFKTMGTECLEGGLSDILQAPDIMKVIHDCRLPSDLLYHQFKVNLVNIFDTQVAAAMIHRQRHGGVYPRYAAGLPDCLQEMMDVQDDQLSFPLVRDLTPQTDEEAWGFRPTPSVIYDWLKRQCCPLLELREGQLNEMMMEFVLGVDLFLGCMRDANQTDNDMRREQQHMLPSAFSSIQRQMIAMMAKQRKNLPPVSLKYIAASKTDGGGRAENCQGVSHPDIVASHDSVWHKPNYSKRFGPRPIWYHRWTRTNPVLHKMTGHTPLAFVSNDHQTLKSKPVLSGSVINKTKPGTEQNKILNSSEVPNKIQHHSSNSISSKVSSSSSKVYDQKPAVSAQPSAPFSDSVSLAVQKSKTTDASPRDSSTLCQGDWKSDSQGIDLSQSIQVFWKQIGKCYEKTPNFSSQANAGSIADKVHVRPAGLITPCLSKSQCEYKEPAAPPPTDCDCTVQRSATSSCEDAESPHFLFDAIPTQQELDTKYRTQTVDLPSNQSAKTGGFKINFFTEIAPPPFYKQMEKEAQTFANKNVSPSHRGRENSIENSCSSSSSFFSSEVTGVKSPESDLNYT